MADLSAPTSASASASTQAAPSADLDGTVGVPSGHATGAIASLERLRRHRVRRPHPTGLGHVVSAIRREATKQRNNHGGLSEVWDEIVPASLSSRTRVDSVRSGVVRLVIADPSTRYEVDAFLRGGGLQELRLRAGQPIRQVRCVIGSLETPRSGR